MGSDRNPTLGEKNVLQDLEFFRAQGHERTPFWGPARGKKNVSRGLEFFRARGFTRNCEAGFGPRFGFRSQPRAWRSDHGWIGPPSGAPSGVPIRVRAPLTQGQGEQERAPGLRVFQSPRAPHTGQNSPRWEGKRTCSRTLSFSEPCSPSKGAPQGDATPRSNPPSNPTQGPPPRKRAPGLRVFQSPFTPPTWAISRHHHTTLPRQGHPPTRDFNPSRGLDPRPT